MKIVKGYPPNYDQIKKTFDLKERKVVFTYGNILYNPYGFKIPKHLEVHEETHYKQQANYLTAGEWWDKYLSDPEFRIRQELEAYINQFRFYKTINKAWMPFLKKIAADLSSSMYGSIISSQEAFNKILYGQLS